MHRPAGRARRLAAAVLALTAGLAAAQTPSPYPTKPIRLIVPIAAGSVTDVVLRAAAPLLSERLGQPLLIDNRTGAGGIVGAEACAKAPPDGYTLCAMYQDITSLNPFMYEKLPYDPAKDFAPVGRLLYVTTALVVPRALPVNTVAELKAYALQNPRAVNLGTLGEGSVQELFGAWLNREWKTQIVGVPYKGGAPIANAVAAGEIQMGQMGLGNFIGLVQAGQLRALALSTEQRSKQLPDVPTNTEAGLGGFPAKIWWGIAAPAATPTGAIARFNAAMQEVFSDPKMRDFMEARYVEAALDSPQDFAAFLVRDRERTGALVRLAREPAR
ncbi:MAG: tripartite tricarboxylate transporter substrate-binding protein [Pseudomonadota bacterium]